MILITKVVFFLFLSLISYFKKIHGLSTEHIKFSDIPDFRGKICLESHTVLARITGSAIQCVHLCADVNDEECKVSSFEMSSSTCYGCGTTDLDQMTDANSVSFMSKSVHCFTFHFRGAQLMLTIVSLIIISYVLKH